METRSQVDLDALRAAYLAIPKHLQHYVLGDMDAKDWPLRVLCTPVGEKTPYAPVVRRIKEDDWSLQGDAIDLTQRGAPKITGVGSTNLEPSLCASA